MFTKRGRLDCKKGHIRPPKDAPKEDGPLERRANLPKGGRLATGKENENEREVVDRVIWTHVPANYGVVRDQVNSSAKDNSQDDSFAQLRPVMKETVRPSYRKQSPLLHWFQIAAEWMASHRR